MVIMIFFVLINSLRSSPQSDWHSETQLHKEILHVLLVVTTLQPIQTWDEGEGGTICNMYMYIHVHVLQYMYMYMYIV